MSKPTIAQIRRKIARIPTSKRCSPTCPCWIISERDDTGELHVERCDECVGPFDPKGLAKKRGLYLFDGDVARLPEAKRELARVIAVREYIAGTYLPVGVTPPAPATAPEPAPAEPRCCCSVCGSLLVEYTVWYDPNTRETGEMFGSWNAGDNTFCADCSVEGRNPNPDLLDEKAEPDKFKAAREIRAQIDAGADPADLIPEDSILPL